MPKTIEIESVVGVDNDIISITKTVEIVQTESFKISDVKDKLAQAIKNKGRAEKEIAEYQSILKDYTDTK